MKKERTKTIAWWGIISLTVLFIWGQSLLGQELSIAQSESVQGLLGKLFGDWVYDTFLYRHIRKVAHFTEFALLGAEWMGYRLCVCGERRPPQWLLFAFGPIVAGCDELLQFASNRAPRISDVLLDCSGYVCGGAVIGVVYWICKQIHKDSCKKDLHF